MFDPKKLEAAMKKHNITPTVLVGVMSGVSPAVCGRIVTTNPATIKDYLGGKYQPTEERLALLEAAFEEYGEPVSLAKDEP